MVGRGRAIATEALYRKRWYAASTHHTWGADLTDPEVRARWIPDALADLAPSERESLLADLWHAESVALRARAGAAERDAEALASLVERLRADLARHPVRGAAAAIARRFRRR